MAGHLRCDRKRKKLEKETLEKLCDISDNIDEFLNHGCKNVALPGIHTLTPHKYKDLVEPEVAINQYESQNELTYTKL